MCNEGLIVLIRFIARRVPIMDATIDIDNNHGGLIMSGHQNKAAMARRGPATHLEVLRGRQRGL